MMPFCEYVQYDLLAQHIRTSQSLNRSVAQKPITCSQPAGQNDAFSLIVSCLMTTIYKYKKRLLCQVRASLCPVSTLNMSL